MRKTLPTKAETMQGDIHRESSFDLPHFMFLELLLLFFLHFCFYILFDIKVLFLDLVLGLDLVLDLSNNIHRF